MHCHCPKSNINVMSDDPGGVISNANNKDPSDPSGPSGHGDQIPIPPMPVEATAPLLGGKKIEASSPSTFSCPDISSINFQYPWSRKLGEVLQSGELSDVEFIVGETQECIRAHKLILGLSSPVFYRQFFGRLPSEDVVHIPDCDPYAFRLLLQFIYTNGTSGPEALSLFGNDNESLENKTAPVLYTAHKYDIQGLQDLCALKLSLCLSSWNVISILHTAELYNLQELGGKCWNHIQSNTRSVLNFHQHSIDYPTLLRIVKDDNISIEEVKLFEFLNSWAENECEKEDIMPTVDNKLRRLGEVLRYVRFPTMPPTDFADRVAPKGLLKDEEVARTLTYICSSPQNKVFLQVDFPVRRRREHLETSVPPTTSTNPFISNHQYQQFLQNQSRISASNTGAQGFNNRPLCAFFSQQQRLQCLPVIPGSNIGNIPISSSSAVFNIGQQYPPVAIDWNNFHPGSAFISVINNSNLNRSAQIHHHQCQPGNVYATPQQPPPGFNVLQNQQSRPGSPSNNINPSPPRSFRPAPVGHRHHLLDRTLQQDLPLNEQ